MSLIGHVRLQPSCWIAEWDTLNHLCFLSSACNWSPVEQTCLLSTPHSQGVPDSQECTQHTPTANLFVRTDHRFWLFQILDLLLHESFMASWPLDLFTNSLSSRPMLCLLSLCPGGCVTLCPLFVQSLSVYLVGKLTSPDTFCGKYFYYRTLNTNELLIIDQTRLC